MSSKAICAALAAGLFLATAAHAQSGRDPYVPAELPPASFDGTQYVDSTGCAFIRAGVGGMVNWVPRFDRDRNPVCGLAPSMPRQTQVAAAPATQPTPKEPVRAASPSPAPKVATRPAAPVPAKPAPAAVPAAAPAATMVVGNTCPNYDTLAQHWVRTASGGLLRCGPQRIHPSDGKRTDGPGGRVWQPDGGQRPVPEGYRPAWTDDRLNPDRARGTAQGDAQMQRTWTQTVPQQLVNPTSRAATVPYDRQVSTRSATPQPATAQRFVQIGSFGVPSNAHGAATRFQAQGLPVRVSTVRQGGRNLQVVMIGPLGGAAEVERALNAARQAGFRDAFVRG